MKVMATLHENKQSDCSLSVDVSKLGTVPCREGRSRGCKPSSATGDCSSVDITNAKQASAGLDCRSCEALQENSCKKGLQDTPLGLQDRLSVHT